MGTTRDSFLGLVEGVCRIAGIPQPQQVADGADFEFEGLRMALVRDAQSADGLALIHAEFGPPPAGRELELCELLLRTNLLLNRGCSPSYGMRLESRSLVFMAPFAIAGTTPENLVAAMSRAAATARLWRETEGLSSLASAA